MLAPKFPKDIMATVLYRKSLMEDSELEVLKKYFPVTDCMVGINNDVVIGRYSCVPFYSEVQQGLAVQGSRLINSLHEHSYIANFDYYWDIEKYTPKTWFKLSDVPEDGGPYVVKGVTTSKKSQWDTMMYAPDRKTATRIAVDLMNDYYIGSQDIIVRQFETLKCLGIGINGMRFNNEWRCFFYKKQMLSAGFYFTESDIMGEIDDAGYAFVNEVAQIVGEKTTFYTIDIGQKEDGSWIVVEMNDAQMAGFSYNDPDVLFGNLAKLIN